MRRASLWRGQGFIKAGVATPSAGHRGHRGDSTRRDVGHRLRLRPTYPIDSPRLIGWVLTHRRWTLAPVKPALVHWRSTRAASLGCRDAGHRLRLRPTYPIDSRRLIGWVLTHRRWTLDRSSLPLPIGARPARQALDAATLGIAFGSAQPAAAEQAKKKGDAEAPPFADREPRNPQWVW